MVLLRDWQNDRTKVELMSVFGNLKSDIRVGKFVGMSQTFVRTKYPLHRGAATFEVGDKCCVSMARFGFGCIVRIIGQT